jgi:protein Tex
MSEKFYPLIAAELGLDVKQISATATLLSEGGTIPFIARYRKEATGLLDEVVISAIRDRLEQLTELEDRRAAILKSLTERELLTDELRGKILSAETMTVLEDIYLPFRPKRRTRAMIAREKGLEPLAEIIFQQDESKNPEIEAQSYLNQEADILCADDAMAGARDIIAEWMNESQTARSEVRRLFFEQGIIKSRVAKGKEEDGRKYLDYFDWQEPVASAPSHRVLAMRRGENDGFLTLRILPPEDEAILILERQFIKNASACAEQVKIAVKDSYGRLLSPSMETETRLAVKKTADLEAIRIFADNLRQLLLAPPLGHKSVLAVDPGLRTGCKLACLDRQGKMLHHETIYPLLSEAGRGEAAKRVSALCRQFAIEAVAIGNGTGGRETEVFIRSLDLSDDLQVVMVNESGASVYSASKVAREEFPDCDLTVRGSVSIGRRLQDPLAELVKVEPKSIGVGQYQHDVDQSALKKSLDDVVERCVNTVGVDLNSASPQLLNYVSGLGQQLAQNIVVYRDEKGPFHSRQELKKVPRLGPKAFEQAAGFLRIQGGENPLDASAVHPESYPLVFAMAQDAGCSVKTLMEDAGIRGKIDIARYVTETTGMPTLTDIMAELSRPGRDPRDKFEEFSFEAGIERIEDLNAGMSIPGIVTNVTAFGAFVDIGVHQDGLVHISELSDHFVKDPHQVIKLRQQVRVTVLSVDLERKRISLSMKSKKEISPESVKQDKETVVKIRKPPKDTTREKSPFNNPFADAFGKKR